MKKISLLLMMMLAISLVMTGCKSEPVVDENEDPTINEPTINKPTGYDDGTYRGTYGDRNVEQIGIEFEIEDNVFTVVTFRQLSHAGNDYRSMVEGDPMYGLKLQYEQAAEYLVGKPVEAMNDLHTPGDYVDDVDGYSGATIRSNKLFSAIKDGLNRGLYASANIINRDVINYYDGTYRGTYGDLDNQQMGIEFGLKDNVFTELSFRQLSFGGHDYRSMPEGDPMYGVKLQYEQAANYLIGKPLEAVFDLHSPGDFVNDVDGYSGATIKSNKLFSAIKDGLNRGLYVSAYDGFRGEMATYDDGRYRGIYKDNNLEEMGVEFEIEDNVFIKVGYRQLHHDGNHYRAMVEGDPMYGIKLQFEQAADYLVGKPLEAIYDLHSPGGFVNDVDGYSGATIQSNKLFSAIMDGLNRGLY